MVLVRTDQMSGSLLGVLFILLLFLTLSFALMLTLLFLFLLFFFFLPCFPGNGHHTIKQEVSTSWFLESRFLHLFLFVDFPASTDRFTSSWS